MKKVVSVLMTIALIGFFLVSSTFTVLGNQNEGAWVLVEVIDKDGAEEIAKSNKDYEGVYHIEGNYSRNNYSVTSTYIGPSDDYYDPPKINGESLSFTASFSEPPQVIYADDEITINISLSAVDNHSYFNPFASVKARIGKNDQSYSRFRNEEGEDSFRSDIKNNYASINENVTAVAPGGSEGDILEIGFTLYFGVSFETWYVYEWQMVEGAAPETEQPTPTSEMATPEPYIEPTPENCIDSGIRFSDLAGEVLVRPHDDILAWDMAELDMVLCVMDHIKTSYDSYAILSLRDMSTMMMKPESEVILNTEPKESKLSLLAGKLWVNLNNLWEHGEFRFETSQAVAGIKGTTLVLEEDGSTSTLKVLEGTVELTTVNGETVLVSDEETVSVTNGVLGQVTTFSAEEEMENWDENLDAEGRSTKTINFLILALAILAILGFGLVVVAVIIFLLLRKKKGSQRV
jgi:hypothetical protein